MVKADFKTVKFALIQSMPVLFGYVFLGIAFGILLQQAGYNFIWAFFISLTVFAGSLQFVLVPFLSTGAALPTVLLMTLFINSRHMFYGLSFVERFKKMGRRYPYMVFSLTDETYSVFCSLKAPDGVDEDTARFLVALFNQSYWVTGSILGALIGQLIPFDFTGIEFSMTALFVVIFLEQWKTANSHLPAVIGLVCGVVSLLVLGTDHFLLPAIMVTVAMLLLFKPLAMSDQEKLEVSP